MQQATRTDDWPDPLLTQVMEQRRDLGWVIFQIQRRLESGDTSGALATMDRMIQRFPDSVELRMEQIRTRQMIGRLQDAMTATDDALNIQPLSARLHRVKGLLHFQQNQLEEATACFQRAVDLKPDYSLAHFNLAACLLDLGDQSRALEEFRTARRLQPDLPDVSEQITRLEKQLADD